MPSALPDGDPAPEDGRLPESALRRPGGAAVRVLRARAVLHGPLRLLRLQHLHAPSELGTAGRLAGDVRRGGDRRDPAGPRACSGDGDAAGRRRCSSAVGRRRCCRPATSSPWSTRCGDEFGLVAGRRGDHRVQPGQRHARRPGGAARRAGINRVSFGMQSAVPHVLRRARPHPRPGAGARASSTGHATAGLRAGQPRPDLRHAGGVARGLGDVARRGAGVRPDHVSAYSLIVEDGTALARQVRRGECCRCRTRTTSPTSTSLADEALAAAGLRLVRGVQLGKRRRTRGAGTTWLYWTGADWWGVGPGAHSHVGGVRWWNVKHPTAYADAHRRRVSPGARPRGARRRDPAGRAGAARDPAARGAAGRRARRRRRAGAGTGGGRAGRGRLG